MKKKNQELASAELQRLRGGAKIDYLNKAMMPDPKSAPTLPAGAAATSAVAGADAPAPNPATPAATTTAAAPEAAPASGATDKAALDRGALGLK